VTYGTGSVQLSVRREQTSPGLHPTLLQVVPPVSLVVLLFGKFLSDPKHFFLCHKRNALRQGK